MKLTKLASFAVLLSLPLPTLAGPWIESDDPLLRASIELLFNQGVIKQPINSYPLMWQGIARDLNNLDRDKLSVQSQFALQHIKHALANAKRSTSSGIRANYNSDANLQQSFGSRDQQKSGVNSYGSITGNRVSAKVSINYADEALDDKYTNYQGSYLAVLIADWSISAEQISHWWGPSNDNALLLSNNAAPMKGVRVNRANTQYDGPSFFSFIGNWQLTGIYAKQKPTLTNNDEGDYWAMRFASTPLPGLEIAFSTSGSDFLTSSYIDTTTLEADNKKQQLTSLDAKYSTQIAGQPLGFYAEIMGRNDSGFAPNDPFYTLGVETFFADQKQLLKTYLEYTNTQQECVSAMDCTYGNDTLTDISAGYIHKDRLIGSSTPYNSKSAVLGAQYHTMNGYAGFAKLRWLNGKSLKTASAQEIGSFKRVQLELGYQQALFEGLWQVSGSVFKDELNKDSDTNTAVKTSWEYRF
ncbi:capsule assembly Wzi family protein [Pseudoalteromonas sp. ZZD1]|uniref:capsule assembly Wzi family protein n=1 Tax=Pseudoalteromonas sp. ZZD1 TaxID=3139395 RepID=UPI003BACE3E3